MQYWEAKNYRQAWVDYVRVISCVLYAIGILVRVMVEGGAFPDIFPLRLVIFFCGVLSLPMLFLCCGYLCQEKTDVHDINTWLIVAKKKAYLLGLPVVLTALASYLLKGFSPGLEPCTMVCALLIIFFLTPTFRRNQKISGFYLLIVPLIAKILYLAGFRVECDIINAVLCFWAWFILGMLLSIFRGIIIEKSKPFYGYSIGMASLVLAVVVCYFKLNNPSVNSFLAISASYSIIVIFARKRVTWPKLLAKLSDYSMSNFLLHPIFMAITNSVLFRMSVESSFYHLALCMLTGFVGPVLIKELIDIIAAPLNRKILGK